MFIKIENLKIHYKVSGNGQPIILLHGWGGSMNYFARLQTYLAKKFTVYALDLPGFGLSTSPTTVWGGADFSHLVEQFINELKIVKPILIGHSFGGKIVINLVARDIVTVKKIILISSSGVNLPKTLRVKIKIYFFKLLKFLTQLPGIKNIFSFRIELYKKRFGSSDYQNASGVMRKIMVKTVNEDIRAELSKIKVPTLLIWGDRDPETRLQAGQIMHQNIVHSELQIIAGSGHYPFLDNWEQVVLAVDKFLVDIGACAESC